jgi:hypothetical protein
VKGWWRDGVTKAVDEFAATVDCDKAIIGTQFLLRKRRGAGAVQAAGNRLGRALRRRA